MRLVLEMDSCDYEFYTPNSSSAGIDNIDEFFENNPVKSGIFKVFLNN